MNNKFYVSGIGQSSKAHFISNCLLENNISNLLVISNEDEIENTVDDLQTFLQTEQIKIFLYPHTSPQERIVTLSKILTNNKKNIIVTTEQALNMPVATMTAVKQNTLVFNINGSYNYNKTTDKLQQNGYLRVAFVEEKGQFAVRGEIIDIWPYDKEDPVRITFEFNKTETIKTFDYITQKSNGYLKEISILPCMEKESAGNTSSLLEQLNKNYYIFCDEEVLKNNNFDKFNLIINSPLNKKAIYYPYSGFSGFQGDIKYFVDLLKMLNEKNINIKIYCSNASEQQRMLDILHKNNWKDKIPEIILAPLWFGFYLKDKLAVISSKELLYKRKQVSFPKFKSGKRLEGIWEITANDYVVHEKYGIGRYRGLKKITQDDKTAEYLCIEYKNKDKLYVPFDEFKVVKKYIGVEGVKPKLYSMDTFAWEHVKQRARENASLFAKELLQLYAQRAAVKRTPYPEETSLEADLANSFMYEETADQVKAIKDIENDFAKPYPMERLICGDVGFGKTEVAIRAAFKVACNSKQVAVLVPTTVLAQQHYNTFTNRLVNFPIKTEVLSRFQTKKQQKQILENVKNGKTDIVIGTHRLLQKDVEFSNLGLLIIDEEHRFGVKQKEKIKMIKKNIDMLLLSATPIPRTLSGALYGLRDLSLIETQPVGRQPIETVISTYDKKLIKNVIEAEISRGGQVFYVYNKVETILNKAHDLNNLVKDIKLGVIHGQMKSNEIEKIMWQFINKQTDVLLATTIIESGIDIPTVNSMIIEDSVNFGLSQLHQLRGRIGRDKQKAYCYLLYDKSNLTDESVKRLQAMKEFSELGSGYKLALKDLEIRGAGAILSAKQHGFVKDVGFDMFARMLEEEGKKIRNIQDNNEVKQIDTEIDLQVEAYIPENYIEDEDIRILFYRKIANITKESEIDDIKEELRDRFGKITNSVENLFEICKIKIKAHKLSVTRLYEDKNFLFVFFSTAFAPDSMDIISFINKYKNKIEFIRNNAYGFKLKKDNSVNKFNFINMFLNDFQTFIKNG